MKINITDFLIAIGIISLILTGLILATRLILSPVRKMEETEPNSDVLKNFRSKTTKISIQLVKATIIVFILAYIFNSKPIIYSHGKLFFPLSKPGQELQQVNLSNQSLQFANFSRSDLSFANCQGSNLNGARLDYANLHAINLSAAELKQSNLKFSNLSNANLINTNLTGSELSRTKLNRARLSGANLEDVRLIDSNLEDADLSNTNLLNADLTGANLEGANLEGANLEGANLEGARLQFMVSISPDLEKGNTIICDNQNFNSKVVLLRNSDSTRLISVKLMFNKCPKTINDSIYRIILSQDDAEMFFDETPKINNLVIGTFLSDFIEPSN